MCQKLCRKLLLSRFVSEINAFYAEIQGGRQKWPGKSSLVKFASYFATYPAGQKFHRNRSTSLRFRDKHVFAFNAEIQYGAKSGRKTIFANIRQ